MKIFDCFLFFDEEVQLDIRLNTLDKYIDEFVIVESLYSHRGIKRKPVFDIEKYKKFKKKINYILLEEEPKNLIKIKSEKDPAEDYKKILNANAREIYQRNSINDGLNSAEANDFVIISDVDEIPNLKNINFSNIKNKFIFFEQIFSCYKLNLYSENLVWHGSRITKKKYLISPQWLRDIKGKNYPYWRIDTLFSKKKYGSILFEKNGGWHFSYIKDAKGVENKLQSIRHHIDYDLNPIGIEGIENMIKQKKIIYNYNVDQRKNKFLNTETLRELKFERLPEYVRLNIKKFESWINKDESNK